MINFTDIINLRLRELVENSPTLVGLDEVEAQGYVDKIAVADEERQGDLVELFDQEQFEEGIPDGVDGQIALLNDLMRQFKQLKASFVKDKYAAAEEDQDDEDAETGQAILNELNDL